MFIGLVYDYFTSSRLPPKLAMLVYGDLWTAAVVFYIFGCKLCKYVYPSSSLVHVNTFNIISVVNCTSISLLISPAVMYDFVPRLVMSRVLSGFWKNNELGLHLVTLIVHLVIIVAIWGPGIVVKYSIKMFLVRCSCKRQFLFG